LITSEKILVAEDDPQLLGMLAEFLEGLGHEVLKAVNGNQALAALEAGNPHLALLDIKLPDLTGLQLLFLIKAHSPDTEVIMFTGYADLDSAIQALRLGAYDYLVKSDLRLPDLQAAVTRALEHRRLAQANRLLVDHLRQTQEELAWQRSHELMQIRRIGEVLAGPLTCEQLFQGLQSLIWESFGLQVLGLELHGGQTEPPQQAFRLQDGVDHTVLKEFKGWLKARLHSDAASGAIAADADARPQKMPFPAMLWSKIQAGEVVALVGAGRNPPFTPEEAELFRIFTLQGEAALKNLVLFQEVKRLAIRDGLTGLYNYRHFWEMLAREVEVSRRYGRPLSLLFLDIDDFKAINDTLGHPQGDVVLKSLAAYLERSARHADVVCRYGGEEFVVLLPQTSLEQAGVLAERLRLGISQNPIDLAKSKQRITVSIGMAQLGPQMDGEALVKAADNALYRAKQAGKNRVCTA
jgi:diguanylate cyclase (GGDEF)-like protein